MIHRGQVPIRIARFLEITPEIAFAMGLYLQKEQKAARILLRVEY
jgi:hypothetical protein